MKTHSGKNIIAFESWEGFELEPRAGMKPLLDFLSITNGIHYNYNFVRTPNELEYILKQIPTRKYSLMYLAVHGDSGRVSMGAHKEFTLSLGELGDMMGNRFAGFGLHFASCAVLNDWMDSIKDFKLKTGLSFISGFSNYVDFQSSSIVDHALIAEWIHSRSYKRMFDRLTKKHKALFLENGFSFFI